MNMYALILVGIIGLCWGSFLNVLALRLISDRPFWTKRSACPFCNKTIAWFDLIPILSWFLLGARCRACKHPISIIYPMTELLTGVVAISLYLTFATSCYYDQPCLPDLYEFLKNSGFFFYPCHSYGTIASYCILFSGLLAGTATDFYAMVIPQLFSIYLIPFGLCAAYMQCIPISVSESILGALIGYGVLWITGKIFYYFKKIEGIGVGDMEFLALIGSFTGIHGAWTSLMIGSLIGVLVGGCYLIITKKELTMRIPFGPFLALGAYCSIFLSHLFP